MMKVATALKTLERNGFSLTTSVTNSSITHATHPQAVRTVSIYRNGGEYSDTVALINVRRPGDNDDPQSDYSAGENFKVLKRAIEFAFRA